VYSAQRAELYDFKLTREPQSHELCHLAKNELIQDPRAAFGLAENELALVDSPIGTLPNLVPNSHNLVLHKPIECNVYPVFHATLTWCNIDSPICSESDSAALAPLQNEAVYARVVDGRGALASVRILTRPVSYRTW
jgi:hypothetical protein